MTRALRALRALRGRCEGYSKICEREVHKITKVAGRQPVANRWPVAGGWGTQATPSTARDLKALVADPAARSGVSKHSGIFCGISPGVWRSPPPTPNRTQRTCRDRVDLRSSEDLAKLPLVPPAPPEVLENSKCFPDSQRVRQMIFEVRASGALASLWTEFNAARGNDSI